MKLFEGLSKTDYQDVLRALGRFIDTNNYIDIRIVETEDGLVFQGRPSPRSGRVRPGPQFETFLITDDDIRGLLQEAYEQRGKKVPLKRL
jgi:hypothetical protein